MSTWVERGLLVTVAVVSCSILAAAVFYVVPSIPSEADIRESRLLSVFLWEPAEVRGLYSNNDKFAVAFAFRSEVAPETAILRLRQRLRDDDWSEQDPVDGAMRFTRSLRHEREMYPDAVYEARVWGPRPDGWTVVAVGETTFVGLDRAMIKAAESFRPHLDE